MRKVDEGMNAGKRPVIFFYVSLGLILLLFLVTRWHSFSNWVILLLALASFLCTCFIGQELADGKEEGLVLVFLYTIVPCFTLTKFCMDFSNLLFHLPFAIRLTVLYVWSKEV